MQTELCFITVIYSFDYRRLGEGSLFRKIFVASFLLIFFVGNLQLLPIVRAGGYPPSTAVVYYSYFRSPLNREYTVRVFVNYVENLWRLNITLRFNSTIATVLGVLDSGFLNQPYQNSSVINNLGGVAQFLATQSDPAPPKTGGIPPMICAFIFNSTATGRNLLRLSAGFFDRNGIPIAVNAEGGSVDQEIPPSYWSAQSFEDYSPKGMPDFDQNQNQWDAFCVPTAIANALWWLDSKYETAFASSLQPPPTISDNFPLVTSYNSVWDDHDPRNVQPLIEQLAYLLDTNGLRTGIYHWGTDDLNAGLSQYLQIHGVNPVGDADGDGMVSQNDWVIVMSALGSTPGSSNWGMRADLNQDNRVDSTDLNMVNTHMGQQGMFAIEHILYPTFNDIKTQFATEDAVLLNLQFYYAGTYYFGHEVTVAGINVTAGQVLISDPAKDSFEKGLALGRTSLPHSHSSGEESFTLHNDAQYASYDAYVVGNGSTCRYLSGYGGGYVDDQTGEILLSPPAEQRIEWLTTILYIGPEHNVAVTGLKLSKTIVGQTSPARIDVTVENLGDYGEVVNVTVYADSTIVQAFNGMAMPAHTQNVLTVIWNTVGFARGYYTISANVSKAPHEVDLFDNVLVGGKVLVTVVGDVNGDKAVNVLDLILVASHLGHTNGDGHTSYSSDWYKCMNTDLNNDNQHNVLDLILCANHLGQNWP